MHQAIVSVFDISHPFCGAVSLFALAYKLRDLRRDSGNLSLRGMCGARLGMGLAYLCLTPACYVRIDRLTGIPNFSTLLGHCCIVLGALSSHLMVLGWFNQPEEARRRARRVACGYGLALTAMVVLFLRAPLAGERPVDFTTHFAGLRTAGLYSIVFLGTYGLNLANTARWTFPSSRAIARPWLKSSLRMTAFGSVFVIGFLVGKLIGLAGRWAGTDRLDLASVFWAPLLASTGSLVIVGGSTLPGWGRQIMVRLRRRRSFRRLYPMWFALYQATPGIALFEPRSARTPFFVRDVETHLLRLIIEIRDGQRSLLPYLDDAAPETALWVARRCGLPPADLKAAVEACTLSLGIRRRGRGVAGESSTEHNSWQPGSNLAAELVWLERVSGAFAAIESQRGLRALLDRLAAGEAVAAN